MIIKNNNNAKMVYELNVISDHFDFATSIESALDRAKKEYNELDLKILESLETIKKLTPECDKQDYILAATCGALSGIIDIFLVGKPGESSLGKVSDKWFQDRTKDFAKFCGWKGDSSDLSSAIRYLEKKFKVPYDQRGVGDAAGFIFDLNPSNHHFKSLAHNPTLLGLFFSILDQFSIPSQSHFVSAGEVIALQDADSSFELRGKDIPSKLFSAFINWFGHLISDMSGSSGGKGRGMGIPSPFWCWTNDIIVIKRKLGISVTEFDKYMNEIALNIYKEGYDIRFQAAQAIPVLVNEMLVRFIYSVRRMIRFFRNNNKKSFANLWRECEPFSNATVKRMLTVAHGTFCLIDAGDAAIRGLVTGGGGFNVVEFTMRLNIVGIGRFSFSLYGEVKQSFNKGLLKENVVFLTREKIIIEDYIKGLEYLSDKYNDKELLTFIDDLRNSDMYKIAFAKSAELAKKRNVSLEKILQSKSDIDSYFGGEK